MASRDGGPDPGISERPSSGRAAGIWPAVSIVLVLSGCGGATAPCPTPTTELDRLRTESQAAEGKLDQATEADRELKAKRDAASRRIETAQAALDSLGSVGPSGQGGAR
jgi:hypothetical protein